MSLKMKLSLISDVCVVCCALWINFAFCIDRDEPQWTIVEYPGLDDLYNRAQIVAHEEDDYINVKEVCSSMIQSNAFKVTSPHQNNFQSTIQGTYSTEDLDMPDYVDKPNFLRYKLKMHHGKVLVIDLYPCFRADDSSPFYFLSPGYRHHDQIFFVFLVNSSYKELSLEGLVSRTGSDVNDFNKYFIEESHEAGEYASEESSVGVDEVANAGTDGSVDYPRERINQHVEAQANVFPHYPAVVSNYKHVHQHPFAAGSLHEDSDEESDTDASSATLVTVPNNQLRAGTKFHHPFYVGSLHEEFGEADELAGSGTTGTYVGHGEFYEEKRHKDSLEAGALA